MLYELLTYIILVPCEAGHQPNGDNNGCEVCPLNTYKTAKQATDDWKSQCSDCADGQETVGTGSTESNMCFGKSRVPIQRGEMFHTFNQSMHIFKSILKSVVTYF